MARRFRGEYTFKVDGKGRVSIPALFRRVLEAGDDAWVDGKRPELVIVYGDRTQNYLEVYTMRAIGALEDKIARLPSGALKRKLTKRISGLSHQTEVDPDGRLVIPQRLREKIGLDKEAYFIATGDTFQVWNPDTYAEIEAEEDEALGDDLPEDIDLMDALDLTLSRLGEG
ncbi:division/cell wall cluster transcriptional repressor MraZ [Actibacterium sp. MT2.3-13A]|uniref:division/cell wall cluster transcriptional repressor MraZ n=1 Tax=Actibacterium sp. MT2.3-13A TaxID=2828332 RepID=UPI001BAA56FD